MISFIKRHALVTFFVLAYALSWGNYILSASRQNIPFLFPYGPLLAALIVASVTCGRDGLKDILMRCLRWRVGLIWYAAALLLPVAIALAAVSLNVLLGAPMPTAAQLGPWYSLLLLFPVAMIDAPLGEEPGWRGYAMPRFPASRSPLENTLMLGVLLAGWHLPLALAGGAIAAPYLISTITSAVVTNWVYYNAHKSALFAILYHTSANTMGLYLFPAFLGSDFVRLFWLLAAMNCAVAVVLAFAAGPDLRRQPHL
jgi:uncharacterized protein